MPSKKTPTQIRQSVQKMAKKMKGPVSSSSPKKLKDARARALQRMMKDEGGY